MKFFLRVLSVSLFFTGLVHADPALVFLRHNAGASDDGLIALTQTSPIFGGQPLALFKAGGQSFLAAPLNILNTVGGALQGSQVSLFSDAAQSGNAIPTYGYGLTNDWNLHGHMAYARGGKGALITQRLQSGTPPNAFYKLTAYVSSSPQNPPIVKVFSDANIPYGNDRQAVFVSPDGNRILIVIANGPANPTTRIVVMDGSGITLTDRTFSNPPGAMSNPSIMKAALNVNLSKLVFGKSASYAVLDIPAVMAGAPLSEALQSGFVSASISALSISSDAQTILAAGSTLSSMKARAVFLHRNPNTGLYATSFTYDVPEGQNATYGSVHAVDVSANGKRAILGSRQSLSVLPNYKVRIDVLNIPSDGSASGYTSAYSEVFVPQLAPSGGAPMVADVALNGRGTRAAVAMGDYMSPNIGIPGIVSYDFLQANPKVLEATPGEGCITGVAVEIDDAALAVLARKSASGGVMMCTLMYKF